MLEFDSDPTSSTATAICCIDIDLELVIAKGSNARPFTTSASDTGLRQGDTSRKCGIPQRTQP
jgi:hypothetical protein